MKWENCQTKRMANRTMRATQCGRERQSSQAAAHWRRKRADERSQRSDALERRVNGHICEGREERQRDRQQVGCDQKPERAEETASRDRPQSLGQRKAPEASGSIAVRSMRASVLRSRASFSAPAPAETRPMPSSVSTDRAACLKFQIASIPGKSRPPVTRPW